MSHDDGMAIELDELFVVLLAVHKWTKEKWCSHSAGMEWKKLDGGGIWT